MRHILCFTLFMAIAGCKPTPQPPADYTHPGPVAKGDMLVLGLGGNPPNLVSFLAGETAASTIAGHLYHSLLTYDENLNLKGELAEKWIISPDGKTITFTLRPNLTFSDGHPLTSTDILATFKAITNPTTRTPYAGDYLLVRKAEAPDPRTFRVTYPEPFVPALSSWAGLQVLPEHIISNTPDFNETSLKEKPVGSGPYQLTQWRRGQDLLLTASPYTWQPPHIARLRYRILPDATSQWLELKAGNLDLADLSPLQFSRLTDAPWFTSRYNKFSSLSNTYTFLGFNLKRPLFQDVRVRQALSYAVDRQGIINAVLFGQGKPIAGVFKPGTWADNPNIKPWPYNPALARQMLHDLGWRPGPDGILIKRGPHGSQRFSFTVPTNQNNEVRLRTAQILQKMFADVGVEMKIRVQEWSSFLTTTVKQRDFDAILLGWSLAVEPDPYDLWHSSKTKPDEFNLISYNNAEVDKLIEAARREFNQKKRRALLWHFEEVLAQEQPYLWLYAPNELYAVHKRIVGIKPMPAGITYNQPEWYVPQNWQLRNTLQP